MKEVRAAGTNRRVAIRFLLLLLGPVLAVALALYARGAATEASELSLPTRVQDFVTLALSIVVEALPFVVLGALVSAVIRLYVPTALFTRLLPKRPALRRLYVSLLGTFMPVCECGNVPVARGLMVRGFTVSESTTFLLAAPIVNPVTVLATAQAFRLDPSVVWIRLIGAVLIANLVGGLVSLYRDQTHLLSKGFYGTLCEVGATEGHGDGHGHHGLGVPRWQEGIRIFRDEVSLMLKVLCLGAVIAGATQVFVPREVLTTLGGDPVLSIVAMVMLAFVVSICANVDAFFALAYSGTFTVGSIVAFLIFGPMVDIKMLAMMRTTYKTRLLAVITLLVALSSVLIGLAVNYAL